MTLAFARHRFLIALLGLLALGAWQGHDLMHCLGGEHHEETCSVCALGVTPDHSPAPDLTSFIVPPTASINIPIPAGETPKRFFVDGFVIPRGPPGC